MNENALQVLLVEDNPGDADLVREMLSESEDAVDVHCVPTLLECLDRLAKGNIDVVLLDLTLPDSHGLDTFNTLHAQVPDVPVILLTGLESEKLSLQAMQAGAQDYLVKGKFTGTALRRVLRYSIARQQTRVNDPSSGTQSKPANVVGVIGAKGGVGTTTIACHLGVELRKQTSQKVLLADLDLNSGSLGLLLKANLPYSLMDAAAKVQQLDLNCWQTLVAKGPGDLEIILSPGPQNIENHPKTDSIRTVLRVVRKYYSWMVLDLSRLDALSLILIKDVTSLILVTTPDLLALYETKSILRKLASIGMRSDAIRLIVNYTHPQHSEFSQKDVEDVVGRPVNLSLPESYTHLREASIVGKVLPEGISFREHLAQCAATIAGVERKKPTARKFSMPWFGEKSPVTERTQP